MTDATDTAPSAMDAGAPAAEGDASGASEPSGGVIRRALGMLFDMVRTVATALALSFAIRVIALEPFHIPSESMEPTLFAGDFIATAKFPYGWSHVSTSPIPLPDIPGRLFGRDPDRGDVIMFRNRLANGETWVKRVIGLPGDRVLMRDGRLILNGVAADMRFLGAFDSTDGAGDAVTVNVYAETIPGGCAHMVQQYDYADGRANSLDNTYEFIVPPGHYFVMGDNRDASEDSRKQGVVGYVPASEVIGRAQFVVISLDSSFDLHDASTWTNFRRDRTLKNLSCE